MLANTEQLRRAVELKAVDEAVAKLLAAGVSQEWIDATLYELGYVAKA